MPEPRTPGELPPDLPPEYAEAYRRGYARAYQEATSPAADPEQLVEPERVIEPERVVEPPSRVVEPVETTHAPPLFADELADEFDDDAEPTQVVSLTGTGWRDAEPPTEAVFAPQPPAFDEAPPPWDDDGLADDLVRDEDYRDPGRGGDRPGWWVPALLGGLVLLLVLSAYGIGRIFAGSVGETDVSTDEPDGVVLGEGGEGGEESRAPAGDRPRQPGRERADAYQGRTDLATVGGATATCQAPDSVDAAGNRVGYPPANVYDGDLSTAWRCAGTGVGQSLTLTLAEPGAIGEVGLVPGYAKTDPRSGVDRYAENNRITRVRWTFADGTSVVQRLDGTATNRALQTLRIPVTDSDTVVLEVLASVRGPRNTMAVSEVRVGRAVE